MTSSFLDYFRCPEEFARFGVAGTPGQAPGFFRFGNGVTCFGRSAAAVAPVANCNLLDVLPQLESRGDVVLLPFDADEVVENLRKERYFPREKGSSLAKEFVRKAYYLARPFLSVGVRKHFQRLHLSGRREAQFPRWPIDRTVDNFCAQLMSLAVKANGGRPVPFVWFWPEEYQGCVLMTHDVEHEPGRAFCGTLMDINERHGIRSSFQVVPEERYKVSESFLEEIRAREFEVNVHDLNHDGHLYSSREEFLKRAAKINEYGRKWRAEGFRAGGMYRNAEWIEALQFRYDMSFPCAAHLEPQHGGCCTVMPYFAGDLVELPLTATQDYSLFHILGQYSIDLWKEEVESLVAANALIAFIVHPDYVIERRERQVYENLLQYLAETCKRARLWQPLPREAAEWWRERSKMRLERSSGAWRVAGAGSERARVAYAQIEDGRLTYHLESSPCRESIA
jgi:hypothetical protein